MDPREIDALVQRLLDNPHDREAIAYAHREGTRDPRSYALILEKVGTATEDPAYASHWLTEAANVWSTTLGDAHRTARLLMMAIERDPTYDLAAERLAQLYREAGEKKALAALLERRVATLSPLAAHSQETRAEVVALHEELGALFSQPPLSQPQKALEHYHRAFGLDPQALQAIYLARELHKQREDWASALPLFEAERALVVDAVRKVALYRDEAVVRELAGDLPGATAALRAARLVDPNDAALAQEFGASILQRTAQGEGVSNAERREGADLFVVLAETYDGEHGLAYASAALDLDPGHDRAMQLAAHWAESIGASAELAPRWAAYLQANPEGPLSAEARRHASHADASPELLEVPESADELLLADDIPGLLDAANAAAAKGNRVEALAMYKDVLALDPTQPEALSWVEDHHRQRRQYAELRDVLVQAARASTSSNEAKKQQFREIAGLCETHLRDLDGAIHAYRQICQLDRADDAARDQLKRLLERAARWDDLAGLLEQEAMGAPDIETRILLEKRLAQIHEGKRKDKVAAGEAYARIAGLTPGDDSALLTAVELFTKGERLDLAAEVIAENAPSIEDEATRAALFERLGSLREKLGELALAGDAFVAAARLRTGDDAWRAAERCFLAAELWEEAANSLAEQARFAEGRARAGLLAKEGELWIRAGDEARAIASFEQALELDPANEAYAREVEQRYEAEGRTLDLITSSLRRAGQIDDAATRVRLRKRAAALQLSKLDDRDAARETLLAVLEDGDDQEALATLAAHAEERGDFDEAVSLLRRLAACLEERSQQLETVLREASLLAEGLGDLDGALERYQDLLSELDPKNQQALDRIAQIHEQQGDDAALALTLERMLTLTEAERDRVSLARRLAKLYEGSLDDPKRAIAALETVHLLDAEDFDAIARLYFLSEKVEDFARAAELLAQLLEVEGDDEEISSMSRKLAALLEGKLNRGEEALRVLTGPADAGDSACRDAFVALGDRLGRAGEVAAKLLDWYLAAAPSDARTRALEGAFERFVVTGRDAEAVNVAVQLARSAATPEATRRLEEVAARAKDLDALSTAHDLLSRGLSGSARASELLRQAEVLARAGVDPAEAIAHGELGLASIPLEDAEPMLERLSKLAASHEQVIDLYERQVGRCKQPGERLRALARAARIAAEGGAQDRARAFFALSLSGNVPEEAIEALEAAARAGDEERGNSELRRMLAEALAQGGQGLRDGGRTRSALLRRAAILAERELSDIGQAFHWLGDALIAHVEPGTLDAIERLADQVGEPKRAEEMIERALGEVFDGPLVRQLLARRITLRKERLGDLPGAAEDLKRLHDLAPSDTAIAEELAALLTQLGDHRGMVQLLEDQILRGRDPHARAELARKVARIWEELLDEPREAADAWRRVLRMKPGDAEAQEGLERAKATLLQRFPQDAGKLSWVPPMRRSTPPPRTSTRPPSPSLSTRPSAPPPAHPLSQPPPPPADRASAEVIPLSVEDAELLDEPKESLPSVAPPPMPRIPPLPAMGFAHSGPPALPVTEPEGEVMLVDDAELLDEG